MNRNKGKFSFALINHSIKTKAKFFINEITPFLDFNFLF